MLNITQGGVLQIDQEHLETESKDLKLEVDHIFPRSKLQNIGMGDIADRIGNYRLIVLNQNRYKRAKWPDETQTLAEKSILG